MGQQAVLGINIGTSGAKVIAVTLDGSVIGSVTETYNMSTSQAGLAEQDPQDWWSATVSAIRQIVKTVGHVQVQAIGFSGQMHGLVPLDKNGDVIRPSLIWCDVRSEDQALRLEADISRDEIMRLTQNSPLPNFTLTKLLWMKDHEPDLYTKIHQILLPKDYVRYKFTDMFAIDAADASGTLLFNVSARRWSEDMCRAVGIDLSMLPPVFESSDVVGSLTKSSAELLGLRSGIPIVAGAGDQAAGAIGLGALEPGVISAVFGTSGVVMAMTDSPVLDPRGRLHTFCHGQRNSWFVMGVTQAAGGSLQWYRNRLVKLNSLLQNALIWTDTIYS